MNRLNALGRALKAWDAFLGFYADVEPGAAFDLRGDPPQYIRDLNRQVIETCADNGIEIDNLPVDVAL